jgi:hypothetical protein
LHSIVYEYFPSCNEAFLQHNRPSKFFFSFNNPKTAKFYSSSAYIQGGVVTQVIGAVVDVQVT